jgi:hypothetical protein
VLDQLAVSGFRSGRSFFRFFRAILFPKLPVSLFPHYATKRIAAFHPHSGETKKAE